MSELYQNPEDRLVPYTVREQRRTDRLERAVIGYADEAGVWVPGVLTQISDWRDEEIAYRNRIEEAEKQKQLTLKQQDEKREREFRYVFGAIGTVAVTGLANFSVISGIFEHVMKAIGR